MALSLKAPFVIEIFVFFVVVVVVVVYGSMLEGVGWGCGISCFCNLKVGLMLLCFLLYRPSNLIPLTVFHSFSILFYST